jgi:CRP-like cAMP-binding protein
MAEKQLFERMLPGFQVTPNMQRHLYELTEKKEVKKGNFWLQEGQICRYTSFVEQGLLMYYTVHDGDIKPIDFALENDWAAYMKSFSQQVVGDMNIVALEDTVLHAISYDNLQEIFKHYPQLIQIQLKGIQDSLAQVTQHATNLASLSAPARYDYLIDQYPKWIQRVPQYHLAAYLGIRPQSLSRIRKNKRL